MSKQVRLARDHAVDCDCWRCEGFRDDAEDAVAPWLEFISTMAWRPAPKPQRVIERCAEASRRQMARLKERA